MCLIENIIQGNEDTLFDRVYNHLDLAKAKNLSLFEREFNLSGDKIGISIKYLQQNGFF